MNSSCDDGVGDTIPYDATPEIGAAGDGTREIVLVTGISGSGKSIALHALEDAGFFCVDNLPPELLPEFLRLEKERSVRRVAVAVDVRTAGSLPRLVPLLESLRAEGVNVRPVFLDASTDTLVRRFSETRRPHPLSKGPLSTDTHRALIDAIELERELLAGIRVRSTILDTSQLRPVQLRQWMRDLVGARLRWNGAGNEVVQAGTHDASSMWMWQSVFINVLPGGRAAMAHRRRRPPPPARSAPAHARGWCPSCVRRPACAPPRPRAPRPPAA